MEGNGMGKMGRLVVDAHVHVMGHSIKNFHKCRDEKYPYRCMTIAYKEHGLDSQVDDLLTEMDRYGIDMGVALGATGLTSVAGYNEQTRELVRKYPDRFIGFCVPIIYATREGEVIAKEIEECLRWPEIRGVGEWSLASSWKTTWEKTFKEIQPILDVIAKTDVPILFHTGAAPYGRVSGRHLSPLQAYNPIWIDEIAQVYPDIPLIIGHMGVQGYFYFGAFADMALLAAARNENVYLETSSAPLEVVEKAVCDPAIGPDKVIFGTDFPAPFRYYAYKDRIYPSYTKRPPTEFSKHYRFALGVIEQLKITDDERAMILGGNIARLLKITR
jgi:predicted TIM-barrel fold metal-dependent hydrolase